MKFLRPHIQKVAQRPIKVRKVKFSHKCVAVFLAINMVSSFLPYNLLANNNGPTSPEATSFEPVDATDMVNLATGDLSYVLPLLNVPSPEGGYPLALAYHAGIAMDQEASWTGLGWNLNAGAINRSVNGYPDDYNNSQLTEYFYDQGSKEDYYSLSLGYTNGGVSVGVNLSWGSNRSLGGSVSIGVGPKIGEVGPTGSVTIGTDGASMGVGVSTGSLSFGANISSDGTFGGNIGFSSNDAGFSMGLSSSGTVSLGMSANTGSDNNASLGLTFSSNGVGIMVGVTNKTGNNVDGGVGVGLFLAFNNSAEMGDYTTKSSGFFIPIMVPTHIGVFSFSFGKQTIRYSLNKKEVNYVSGPVYFNEGVHDVKKWRLYGSFEEHSFEYFFSTEEEADAYRQINYPGVDDITGVDRDYYDIELVEEYEGLMDIYDVPLNNKYQFSLESKVRNNNPVFPSYDNYNVQAQGLSGGMSSRLYENGVLFGLTGKENDNDFKLENVLNGATSELPAFAKFESKPFFYFDNEISTYLPVQEVDFNTSYYNEDILSYYSSNGELAAKPRRATGNFIEYFTNSEIISGEKSILKPDATGFDRSGKPGNGIGAFRITAVDGKTYHYSLPVYNHEVITRTFGITDRNLEKESYYEKRQLESFATHWLLTAVTGPDYVDNNTNGKADKGDYGYWVNFEYGKWSDAFIWKTPYGKDYFYNKNDRRIKTWIRGRKELFYLDKVVTRTHTALFIKEERKDGRSNAWTYSSVPHNGSPANEGQYVERFRVPAQNPLRLKKIILLKVDGDSVLKSSGFGTSGYESIIYNDSSKPEEIAGYNLYDNVLDSRDNLEGVMSKSIKSIDFIYDYSLAKGTPNASYGNGRSTLKEVNFIGKAGRQLLPPYKFKYINKLGYDFNIFDKDAFGYYSKDNSLWSLREITTPLGGKIQMEYEQHKLKPVVDTEFKFSLNDPDYSISHVSNEIFKIRVKENIGIKVGELLKVDYGYECHWGFNSNELDILFKDPYLAVVTERLSDKEFLIQVKDYEEIPKNEDNNCNYYVWAKYNSGGVFDIGGIRTKSISTTDGVKKYRSEYRYGQNEDGIGYITYLPFAPDLNRELPFSAELPGPKAMYEYVTMYSNVNGSEYLNKTRYKFNVLKEKSDSKVKFGDFYEIDVEKNELINDSNIDVDVSRFTVKDNLASIGQLLEVAVFNKEDQLLTKTVNDYYPPGTTPDSLGMTKEAYQSYKIVDYEDNSYYKDKWLVGSSARIKYPSLLRSTTSVQNGFAFTTMFEDLDEITGQAKVQVTTSSSGEKLKSKISFAYEKYPQMGSKVGNRVNKNMLTQVAEQKTFISNRPVNESRITNTPTRRSNRNVNTLVDRNVQIQNDISVARVSPGQDPSSIPAFERHPELLERTGNRGADRRDQPNNGRTTSEERSNRGGRSTGGRSSRGRTGDNIKWDLLNVGITTWSPQTYETTKMVGEYPNELPLTTFHNVWRKSKTYIWNGKLNQDGTYKQYEDDFWSLDDPDQSGHWKMTSAITKYNNYSSPLETEDVNGNKFSRKMGDDQSKVFVTGDAAYNNIFFSGAEDDLNTGGVWTQTEFVDRIDNRSHTGKYSVKVPEKRTGFSVIPDSSQIYRLSLWAHKENFQNVRVLNNGSVISFNEAEKVLAGEWVQLNFAVDLTSAASRKIDVTSIKGTVYLDDFRVHPVNASLNSFVYNEWDELTYSLGANNMATMYEYDAAGRLIRVYNEFQDNAGFTGGFKPVKEHAYNYKLQSKIGETEPDEEEPDKDYAKLYMHLNVDDSNLPVVKISAVTDGGSGDFQYRWAIGKNPGNIYFGSWGTSEIFTIRYYCKGKTDLSYYKCEVKDLETGIIIQTSGDYYSSNCEETSIPGK